MEWKGGGWWNDVGDDRVTPPRPFKFMQVAKKANINKKSYVQIYVYLQFSNWTVYKIQCDDRLHNWPFHLLKDYLEYSDVQVKSCCRLRVREGGAIPTNFFFFNDTYIILYPSWTTCDTERAIAQVAWLVPAHSFWILTIIWVLLTE